MRQAALLLLAAAPAVVFLSLPDPPTPPYPGIVVGPSGPVSGASVRWQGAPAHTVSDPRGRFSLPAAERGRRVTAWKDGFLIGGKPGDRGGPLRLTPLPADDHVSYAWIDPTPDPADAGRCGNCHRDVHREWSGGAHARSASGRHFLDLYASPPGAAGPTRWSLLDEHPDGAGVCASCHAPTVAADDPAVFDLRQARGVDRRGVHCDFCHKVVGPRGGAVGLTHGQFGLRLSRPGHGQRFFGPLDDVDRGEDVFSAFQRDSRFCASCHEGVLFGVHVYTTYSEWQASPAGRAGRTCQQCHMRPTGRMANVAPGHGGVERDPATLGNHAFWDGSQAAMLRRCLDLRVETRADDRETVVTLHLTARNVGHRVPTGFIDRQLILVVEASDGAGRPVPARAGPRLPAATGSLQGRPGRLYGRLPRDEFGHGPVPFWQAVPQVLDTRLVPEKPDVLLFRFPATAASLHLEVRHRRFWEEVRRLKGWADQDLIVIDRHTPLPR